MDFNATIDIIIKDLDEARAIIDDLKKYEGVPVLQIELAKSKCKSAGEIIALLKTMGDIGQVEVKVKVKAESQHQPQPQPQAKPKLSQPQPKPDVHLAEEKNIPIIADKFVDNKNSFHDHLGSLYTEKDVTELLSKKQITKLSEAIGVNDKFMFIREVFSGNKDAYLQAIARLDSAESIADAKAVIMSYTGDSKGNVALTQLLDLVKLKLSPNE